jgi:MFS family permease
VVTFLARNPALSAIERDGNFLRLWAAETASKAGDAVSVVAVPLTAVVALGAGPGELATLGAAQLIPIVAFGLPVGAWVDRRSGTRPVMVAADAIRALVILSVPLAAAAGSLSLWHLWTAVFINACLGTFFDVSIAAYVPRLVGREQLLAANARLEASRSAAQVIGPTIAAGLIAALSAPFALVIDGGSFLASSLLVASSRGREHREHQAPVGAVRRRDEILAGARFALREPHLRAITATAMTNNFSRSVAMVVIVVYLVREAGIAPADVALGFALGNTGFIAGALVASRLSKILGVGRAMKYAVSCFWPGMLLLAVAPESAALPAFTVMLFANGFGIAVHNVNQVSVRQAVTPDGMRARVAAASRLLVMGGLPAGTLVGGLLGEVIGLRPTLLIGAAGLFLGSLPYRLSVVGRLRGLPRLEQVASAGDAAATV